MTVKSLAISVLIVTVCRLSSVAQEPELAARVEVDSVMRFTQRVSVFADKLQPKSSSLLILGMVGLTVNPQFANYDLSKPFSILVYSDPKGVVGHWGFCGVLWRRGDASRPFMKIGDIELATRDLEGRSALASSEAILNHIPEDLKRNPSGDPAPGTPDLSLWIDAKTALKDGFIGGLFKPSENPDVILPPEKLEALQARSVKMKSFESLLRQASAVKADLSISEDSHARLSLRFDPVAGSALESFLRGQGGSVGAFPGAVAMRGASVMGAVASKSDAKLAEALSLMYGRIAEATGDEMRANAFSEFALILLMESLEGPGFCVGRHSGKAFGAVSMRVAKDVGRRLETALGRFASRTATPGLFRLREWKSGLASYCLVEEGRIWILSGRFDDDDAADTLSTRSVLPSIEPEPGLLAFATCDESGVSPKMLTARVDGGSLVLKLEFTPSDLDRLPLPPQPSKDKTLR